MSELWKRAAWIEENLLPHEPRIRAWLSRYRIAELDIDDVIQEMYAKFGAMEDVSAIRTPLHYAKTVAHSIVMNHIRRPRIVSVTANGDLDALGTPSAAADPEEAIVLRQEVQAVAQVLAELPERTREVLWLRRVEGLTEQETAQRLAISDRTVERHLARAILHLMARFGRKAQAAPAEDVGNIAYFGGAHERS
ncbi:RNA polymerase sigma-70 factor (ECF subfamily) [Rhizomicrobium palustre]|uniref:RNA polymerase sigma-70 factor (ECF subfamily) n=1 Tax=Rhizomicrobium palustre TaxID=189966 RepID=A0A846N1B9_9PROT|nr:sigma-70 family RNA polymerase sigma factor [Rhizomicrobium palustre]NIK89526.1 RNA polymerase sigma-70 factor (ECF subfamily) [Rhizomicrobium palustre]